MSVARHHAEWLTLVEVSGPFLSLPALLRAFPDGLDLPSDASTLRVRLQAALEEWLDNQGGLTSDPAIHRAWLRFVLREALELEDGLWLEGQSLPASARVMVPEHHEQLAPTLALATPSGRADAGSLVLLVTLVAKGQSLEGAQSGTRWKASPQTRMMTLLHGAGVRLGLLTNGEHWMLVHATPGKTTTYVSFYASLFLEEPLTLRAFRSLLGVRRFFGVPELDTLPALFVESGDTQQEVTDQLGSQVRRAVEVLIQTIDRLDRDRGRKLLSGTDEATLYQAAVTVMMRLVFLFAAEEKGLLLLGDALYDACYAVSTLRDQLQTVTDLHGPELLQRRHDAWTRLLALFRAVHGGVRHETLRLPAYGGSLFDPDRFPFLEGRALGTTWRDTPAEPLAIDNLTVLDILRSLQLLEMKVPGGGVEPRRLSFRALAVEQIGHVYEGLLDHTAKRAKVPTVGLVGAKNLEPEIEVPMLEALKTKGEESLLDFLVKETGKGRPALKKSLAYALDLEGRTKLLRVCDNNQGLYERVSQWVGVVRSGVHGQPIVYDTGAVYVTEGAERRSTGTHYTPKSLTGPIVEHTLAPLVYQGPAEGWPLSEWKLRSAKALLDLEICDLAMGSGAFLVGACEYLATRLVEAWEEAEQQAGGKLVITPRGDLATGDPAERPLPRDPDERLAIARRAVADGCLFGVDKNPLAVEMAKLSLWLITLQKDRPFTFVDHALQSGDSLLGITSREQLEAFHLDPKQGRKVHLTLFDPSGKIRAAFDKAVKERCAIAERLTETLEDANQKARLLQEAKQGMSDLFLVGDLLIGAALAAAGKGGKSLDNQVVELAPFVRELLSEETAEPKKEGVRADLRIRAKGLLGDRTPFHWALEFPEVFERTRSGFDAFVGNPPFMGGLKLETALGTDYRALLVEHLGQGEVGVRGTGDLCAYFFLRVGALLANDASAGLIATNTIAQGDTRRLGLDQLAERGFSIPRAVGSQPWPGTANLEVAHVWLRKGRWGGTFVLDGNAVKGVTSQLAPPGRVEGQPFRLAANAGKSFQGSNVLGLGFTMDPEVATDLIRRDPRNREVLFPYINGEDLNSRPDQTPSRWVINFRDWPLDRNGAPPDYSGPVATDYPDCLALVREKVKPERDLMVGRNPMATRRGTIWWRYAGDAKYLYLAIEGMERVLVKSEVGNKLSFAFADRNMVYSHMLVVFASDNAAWLALLQSNMHMAWAWQYGSTMRTDLRYTPSDCFDTFPFPAHLDGLESIGTRYEEHRRTVMLARQQGLTKTYNRFHSPDDMAEDIRRLRELHVEMDRAVAEAYGWRDLDLGHGFHDTKQGLRYTLSETARREVLDRLLELNHARYAEEVAQGLHDEGKKKAAKAASKKVKEALPVGPPPALAARGQQTGFGFDHGPLFEHAAAQASRAREVAPVVGEASLSAAARALLAALQGAYDVGKVELLRLSGVAEGDWSGAIKELLSAGLVVQEGERRGAKYRQVLR